MSFILISVFLRQFESLGIVWNNDKEIFDEFFWNYSNFDIRRKFVEYDRIWIFWVNFCIQIFFEYNRRIFDHLSCARNSNIRRIFFATKWKKLRIFEGVEYSTNFEFSVTFFKNRIFDLKTIFFPTLSPSDESL